MAGHQAVDFEGSGLAFEQSAFDAAGVIANFMADSACTTIELPMLTTGQRKAVKKLVGEFPEIRCESYGFAAERRLHLFKKGPDAEEDPEVPLSKSAPGSTMSTCRSSSNAGAVAELSVPVPIPDQLPSDVLSAVKEIPRQQNQSLSRSTSASGSDSSPSFPDSESSVPDMPLHAGELQMRNTFVHFERPPMDPRAVQSMPRGMFSRCLLTDLFGADVMQASGDVQNKRGCLEPSEESSKEAITVVEGETTVAPKAMIDGALELGTEVVIEGLVKQPAFNGFVGVVHSIDDASGRYNILLSGPMCGHRWAKLKAENLRPSMPPPPAHLPGCMLDHNDSPDSDLPSMPSTPSWHEQSPSTPSPLRAFV